MYTPLEMGAGRGKTKRAQANEEKPTLTDEQRSELAEVLKKWAEAHPQAGQPVISFPEAGSLTPENMALVIADPHDRDGRSIARVFAGGLTPDGSETAITWPELLAPFRSDTERWTREKEEAQRRESATNAAMAEAAKQAPPVTF